jgi:hypothetical protein
MNIKKKTFEKIVSFTIIFCFALLQIGSDLSKNQALLNLWDVFKYVSFGLWCCLLIRYWKKRHENSSYKELFYVNLIFFSVFICIGIICILY